MKEFTIYHNPRCSKSRQALEILQKHQLHPTVIDYLKSPLSFAQLKELRTHFTLNELVRSNEARFKELKLSLEDETTLLQAIVAEPILLQRPIVLCSDGRSIIARPPEKVLELLG